MTAKKKSKPTPKEPQTTCRKCGSTDRTNHTPGNVVQLGINPDGSKRVMAFYGCMCLACGQHRCDKFEEQRP